MSSIAIPYSTKMVNEYSAIWDQLSYGPDLGYLLHDDFRSVCHTVNQLNRAINTALGVGDDLPVTPDVPQESPAWLAGAMTNACNISALLTQLHDLFNSAFTMMNRLGVEVHSFTDESADE